MARHLHHRRLWLTICATAGVMKPRQDQLAFMHKRNIAGHGSENVDELAVVATTGKRQAVVGVADFVVGVRVCRVLLQVLQPGSDTMTMALITSGSFDSSILKRMKQ